MFTCFGNGSSLADGLPSVFYEGAQKCYGPVTDGKAHAITRQETQFRVERDVPK